jgi:hypothetical protein
MNRWAAAALGALAGAALSAAAFAVAWRAREPGPEAVPGRYQVHAARRLLLLDSATGELWAWRQGAWRRAARPPARGARDEAPSEEPVLWEEEPPGPAPGAEPPAEPPAAPPARAEGGGAPAEPRGRAETIQVPPEAPGPRR